MLFVEIPRILFPIVVIPVVSTSPSRLRVIPDPIDVIPVANTSPSGLKVIPDPTRVFDLNVAIPATSKIPVLTFAVLILQT